MMPVRASSKLEPAACPMVDSSINRHYKRRRARIGAGGSIAAAQGLPIDKQHHSAIYFLLLLSVICKLQIDSCIQQTKR